MTKVAQRVKLLSEQGLTVEEISKDVSLSPSSIRLILSGYSIHRMSDRICALHGDGYKPIDIAQELNVSVSRVYLCLRAAGLVLWKENNSEQNARKTTSDDMKHEVQQLYLTGKTRREIIEATGLPYKIVYRLTKQLDFRKVSRQNHAEILSNRKRRMHEE
jgi:transposase